MWSAVKRSIFSSIGLLLLTTSCWAAEGIHILVLGRTPQVASGAAPMAPCANSAVTLHTPVADMASGSSQLWCALGEQLAQQRQGAVVISLLSSPEFTVAQLAKADSRESQAFNQMLGSLSHNHVSEVLLYVDSDSLKASSILDSVLEKIRYRTMPELGSASWLLANSNPCDPEPWPFEKLVLTLTHKYPRIFHPGATHAASATCQMPSVEEQANAWLAAIKEVADRQLAYERETLISLFK